MSEQYKIVGVKRDYRHQMPEVTGFLLEGVIGEVDPLVGGNCESPEFKNWEEHNAWMDDKVGKMLVCDKLFYRAFATDGEVTFWEGEPHE